MDKAIIGYMRIGHFRIGVRTNHWEQFKTTLENIDAKNMGGIDPAVWFHSRWFYSRWFVLLPLFDEFKEGLEKHG